ncbi:MAG: SDR family NAD(P)-dependent oxidoreductase [Planctomycetota bacterium]
MHKTILITGATDGIGLETAKLLVDLGHRVLVHGRNEQKLTRVVDELSRRPGSTSVENFVADLSDFSQVEALASAVLGSQESLDVLINNAGVYATSSPRTKSGLDVRFAVNTIAPYLLTNRLLPILPAHGRIVNLSSAAQSPVDLEALDGTRHLDDGMAYAQSKLGITMWTNYLAREIGSAGPAVIAVNPGSLLATKMVKDAYDVTGSDIRIGADILRRAALDEEFASASGLYYDNDSRRFAPPHPDALDEAKCAEVARSIESVLRPDRRDEESR